MNSHSQSLNLELLGTIQSRERFYVERPEDGKIAEYLRNGDWVEVFGARLVGKSSLLVHQQLLAQSERRPVRFLYVDDVERRLKGTGKVSAYEWCLSYADWLADELGVDAGRLRGAVAAKRDRGPLTWLEALCADGLRTLFPQEQFVLALDECDRLFEGRDGGHRGRQDFGESLAHVFRGLLNARETRLSGFTFVFIGQRRVSELVTANGVAATGLGESLLVRDFTLDVWQASLAGRVEPSVAEQIWSLSRGQPRLSIELLKLAMAKPGFSADELAEVWIKEQVDGEFKSGLARSIRDFFSDEAARRPHDLEPALKAYREEIRPGPKSRYTFDARQVGFLLDTGLVRERNEILEVTSPLLARVFHDQWAGGLWERLQKRNETAAKISRAEGGKRILIINTGGTIGMFADAKGKVREANPKEFVDKYTRVFEDPSFTAEFEQLFAYDSINVFSPHWSRLARFIWERRKEYNAFVIAHGTDTLAFTASAVGFALSEHLDKPVVFTGAQTTVDVPHGDAVRNLYEACLVARKDLPEVVVCFGNKVFRACRVTKVAEKRFDAFESPAYPELAVISEVVELWPRYLRDLPTPGPEVTLNTPAVRPVPEQREDWLLRPDFEEDVLLIQLSPGMNTHFFNLDTINPRTGRPCQGLVIRTLGSGNIPTEPIDYRDFARRAFEEKGIPVLISSQYPWHPDTHEKFEPGSAAVESGAILTPTMTPAAAETKFRWALAQARAERITDAKQKRERVKTILDHNYIGELEEHLVGANLPSQKN